MKFNVDKWSSGWTVRLFARLLFAFLARLIGFKPTAVAPGGTCSVMAWSTPTRADLSSF